MNEYQDFVARFEQSIKDNWDRDALTDYQGATLQYHDVARKIEKLHILFEHAGLKPGDKVALCGRNCAAWASAFFAILGYGAVAVPILHEFKAPQIHDIVNHSDARLLLVGERPIWEARAECAREIESLALPGASVERIEGDVGVCLGEDVFVEGGGGHHGHLPESSQGGLHAGGGRRG